MANFDQVLGETQVQDQTRASQGWRDTTKGDLFAGLGEAINVGFKSADAFLERRVGDAARAQVEPIRDEQIAGLSGFVAGSGGADAVAFIDSETGEVTAGSPSGQRVPPEIASKFNRLGNIKAGVRAGLLSDTYYRSQLDAVSKSLRRQFPGYEDAIDNHLQNLTGSIPANKLLADLQAQASAVMSAGASSSNKLEGRFYKAVEDGVLDPVAHPLSSIKDTQHLATLIAPRAMAKANMAANSAWLANAKARNEVTEVEATKRSSTDLSNLTSEVMDDVRSGLGKDWAQLQQDIGKIDRTKPLSTEQLLDFQARTDSLVARYRAKAMEFFSRSFDEEGNSRLSILGETKVKQMIDAQVERLTMFTSDLRDGNGSFLTHHNAILGAWSAGMDAQLLSDPNNLKLKSIRSQFGDPAASVWLSDPKQAAVLGNLGTTSFNEASLGIATGQYGSFSEAINKSVDPNMGAAQRMKLGDYLIENTQKVIEHAEMPADLKTRAIKAMYGSGNEGFIRNNADAFSKMAKPSTIAAIKKFADETGQPELYNMAKRWILKTGTGIAMSQAVQLQDAVIYNKYGTITYDPDTHSWSYKVNDIGVGDPRLNDIQNMAVDAYQKMVKNPAAEAAVKQYNKVTQSMAMVFAIENPKASKEDINDYLTGLTRQLGVDIGAAKQPDGLTSFFGAMSEAADKAWPRGRLYGPNGFFRPQSDGSLDFTYTRNEEGQIVPSTGYAPELNTQGSTGTGAIGSREGARRTYQVVPPASQEPYTRGRPPGMMRLGGPEMGQDGQTQDGQGVPSQAYGSDPVGAREGLLQDIKEMSAMYHAAEDPGVKSEFKKELDSLMEAYRTMRQPPVPGENMNTSNGMPEPGLGDPMATVGSYTPGVSLVQAIQTGDTGAIAQEALYTALSVLPQSKITQLIDILGKNKKMIDPSKIDWEDLFKEIPKYEGQFRIPKINEKARAHPFSEVKP